MSLLHSDKLSSQEGKSHKISIAWPGTRLIGKRRQNRCFRWLDNAIRDDETSKFRPSICKQTQFKAGARSLASYDDRGSKNFVERSSGREYHCLYFCLAIMIISIRLISIGWRGNKSTLLNVVKWRIYPRQNGLRSMINSRYNNEYPSDSGAIAMPKQYNHL